MFKSLGRGACQWSDEEICNCWLNLIQDYSKCVFTNSSDRLIGISGLAHIFLKTGQLGSYVAGAWTKFLPLMLAWQAQTFSTTLKKSEPVKKSARVGEPSWSWVSIGNLVLFNTRSFGKHGKDLGVIRVSATLVGEHETGPISDARILARCSTIDVRISAAWRGEAAVVFPVAQGPQLEWIPDVYQWPKESDGWKAMREKDRLQVGQPAVLAAINHVNVSDCFFDSSPSTFWPVLRWSEARTAY